eukprot:1843814-Rhodomonas_salina.1
MDPANTFAVVTMLATIVCVPVALLLEGSKVLPAWNAAIAAPVPLLFLSPSSCRLLLVLVFDVVLVHEDDADVVLVRSWCSS